MLQTFPNQNVNLRDYACNGATIRRTNLFISLIYQLLVIDLKGVFTFHVSVKLFR